MTTTKDIAEKIGLFYLKKNSGKEYSEDADYEATRKEINSLNITNIQVIDFPTKEVVVHLSRPGLLIGRRGTNLDALEAFLGIKIKIVESVNWLEYLVPPNPFSDYDDLDFLDFC